MVASIIMLLFLHLKKLITVLNTICISNTISANRPEAFAVQSVVSINILTLSGNCNKEVGNEQVWQEHLPAEFKFREDVLQKIKSSKIQFSWYRKLHLKLETSFKCSVSHLNHIILSWDKWKPSGLLLSRMMKFFWKWTRLIILWLKYDKNVSKGQLLAWIISLTVISYGFTCEMYELYEIIKKTIY